MSVFAKHPLQRPQIDADGAWNFFGGDFKTYFIQSDEKSFTSRQIFKAGSPHTGVGRQSTATPPYHWHLYQTETFDVKSGSLCYFLDGKEGKLAAGQKVVIPPYVPHTFWNDPTAGTDLDVHITVAGGPNPGFDETFVHNFYGYLSSCTMQNLAPNVFQMLKFMDSADVVLMDFPFSSGRVANVLLGRWIGGYLGGYEAEYKEFRED
ncbi:hypothetical protein BDV98DRAFT_551387 [Pterulicium gracile]|uniref:Cupin type-2 domain-containing protein n=1 Tax=Pterulicium gracile TaxID=1884261 RepID=A0A5C3QEN2_9AGAR|nr:hypothetical protein BDV98DRAFT_551387 [Pterula gracilis]